MFLRCTNNQNEGFTAYLIFNEMMYLMYCNYNLYKLYFGLYTFTIKDI